MFNLLFAHHFFHIVHAISETFITSWDEFILLLITMRRGRGKGKVIPLQVRCGPDGG